MKDDPSEFPSVMNLILPLDFQLPIEKVFMSTYFDNNGIFQTSMIQNFINHTKGRVSYLKAMTSEVKKIFIGKKIRNLKHFVVFQDQMSDFQTTRYLAAYDKDKIERSIFINSRQSSLFVFPDGTYGNDGFNKYVRKIKSNYFLEPALINELTDSNGGSLAKLAKFSSKYANTIRIITNSHPAKSLVYCEYVNGSGAILFAKILELFGYSESNGKETTQQKRYILLTNQTVKSQKRFQLLINKFNRDENIDGKYISVIIGSRVISEGFTFKNIRKEFILTPHWETYHLLFV